MRKIASLATGLALLALTTPASAALITSLPGGTAVPIPAANKYNGHCCRTHYETFEGGSFAGAGPNLWGQTNPYMLIGAPTWEGKPAVFAYSSGNVVFDFTFDTAVASVIADFIWGTQNNHWAPLTISAFDAAGNLLESQVLFDNGAGMPFGRYGFGRDSAEIKRFQVSGAYFALRDMATGDLASGVPEPAAWAMMIIGFGAVGYAVRRSRRRGMVLA
jgi:PEP-CTERM putative exosortase interaction domain